MKNILVTNKIILAISEFSSSEFWYVSFVMLFVLVVICMVFSLNFTIKTDRKIKNKLNERIENLIKKLDNILYLINNTAWILLIILFLIKVAF